MTQPSALTSNQAPPSNQAPNAPAPNAIASARTLEELSYEADRAGQHAAAQFLLHMAIQADIMGGRTPFLFNGLFNGFNTPQPGAFPGRTLSGGAFTGGGANALLGNTASLTDLDYGLTKALAKQSFKARQTPVRINENLLNLGAYDGILDPAQATNQTFLFLSRMARHPIIQAIINTRVHQVTRFAKVARGPHDMGFEIRLRDEKAQMTRAARKMQQQIQDIVQHGGLYRLPNGKLQRHLETDEPGVWDGAGEERAFRLREALAVETRHSLSLDWSCSRIEAAEQDTERFPCVFYSPVDSTYIRRTLPNRYGEPKIDESLTRVALAELSPFNDREVIREFSWDMMSVMVRNPRTDWLGRGYGSCEIETLVDIILSMANSLDFTGDFYSKAHLPYGFLKFTGMPTLAGEQYISGIRQELLGTGGKGNWWDLICMMFPLGPNGQSGNAEFVPFRPDAGAELAGAMPYFNWLLGIACSVYLIDPDEIGFSSPTSKTSTLGEANPESILEHSKDKGVKPLLEVHAERRNRDQVQRIDEDFELAFVGVEDDNEKAKEEIARQRLERGWSPNRIADSHDEERLKFPLDPALYNQVAAKYDEEDFETHDEYQEKVEQVYEKECKKIGYVKFWSSAPDLPVGNAAMMGIIQQEQGENQQAIQQAQMQAQGIDPQNPQGNGAIDPTTGQPIQPGAMQAGAMQAAIGQPGDNAAPNQADANQGQPNQELQPHHFLADESQAARSDSPSESDAKESDEQSREKYKKALQQRLQLRLQQQSLQQQSLQQAAPQKLTNSISGRVVLKH